MSWDSKVIAWSLMQIGDNFFMCFDVKDRIDVYLNGILKKKRKGTLNFRKFLFLLGLSMSAKMLDVIKIKCGVDTQNWQKCMRKCYIFISLWHYMLTNMLNKSLESFALIFVKWDLGRQKWLTSFLNLIEKLRKSNFAHFSLDLLENF